LGVSEKILFKKLDGGKFPDLADKLEVIKFPTLIVFKNGQEVGRKEGYLYGKDKEELQKFLGNFLG
jgi:thiol-disulfide isomerase/thioredoxin